MNDKNTKNQKNITAQTTKSDAQKAADLQLAHLGMRPYNQDDEPASTTTELIDELVPPVSDQDFLKELHREVEIRDENRGAPAVSSEVILVDGIENNDPRSDTELVASAQATVGVNRTPEGPNDVNTPIFVDGADSIRQQALNYDPTDDVQRQQGAA